MLKHVVFMKFKKDATDAAISEIERDFAALPAIIPEIREYLFGRDVVKSERSYDFALVSGFEDLEAMKRYQIHAAHQTVVTKVRLISESILAVDFNY